jgi:hypothetical protein
VSENIKLITGIPRSGTTLCCKLLNQRADVVALHEPIIIPKSFTKTEALHSIEDQIAQFEYSIEQGLPFAHLDKGGLTTDNYVGLNLKNGLRQVSIRQGEVQLPALDKNSYSLIIKQNALFTAFIPALSLQFSMTCIVRNPVDVLLSWLTVDLPVNRGHIPAGERFDVKLKSSLQGEECLSRQLIIYQWFMTRFFSSGLPGAILDEILGWGAIERDSLRIQERSFDNNTLLTLDKAKAKLVSVNCGDLYTRTDIELALKVHGL